MPIVASAAMAGGVAASLAAIASAAAREARVAQCKTVLPNFDAQRATVSEMREYSDCVGTLYPKEIGADATIALKVLFVIALAGMVGGTVWSRLRAECLGWGSHIGWGVLMFFIAPCVAVFAAGVLYGVRWLLT